MDGSNKANRSGIFRKLFKDEASGGRLSQGGGHSGSFNLLLFLLCAAFALAVVVLAVMEIFTRPLSTEQVASKICPSIVGIVQYQKGAIGESGEGSGIIISSDGYIVTNNHVIEDAYKLEVVCSNGQRYVAKPIGSDARTDLAVVKITGSNFKAAKFGNSGKCRVGQQVVAIGNPSGIKLAGSVTQGIISAINRDIDVGNGPMSLIQTDAAINPGNSGGALVNMNGQVIGINSAKIAQQGYEGIGFSIPISSASPIINSIIKYGYVKGRVRIGISCRAIDALTASANDLPAGVYIAYVDPKSDAGANGLKADDIITAFNGVPTATTDALVRERDRCKPGDEATITIYRRKTCGTLIINVKLLEDRGVSGKNDAGW
jgi:serine protease Do